MAIDSASPAGKASAPHGAIGRYLENPLPRRLVVLGYLVLAVLAAAYGFAFSINIEEELPPLFIPLALLAAAALWVMPELKRPPIRTLVSLFTGFIVALLVWPDYIALTITGLPWITAIRLVGIPATVVLLLCAFGSVAFRRYMSDIMDGDRLICRLLLAFIAVAGASVALSDEMAYSATKFLLALWAWFAMFFMACFYFNESGRVRKFAFLLLYISIFCLWIGIYESIYRHLPWAGRIPSFLNVEDPRIEALLMGTARAASGLYRVQSKFITSIGLGEVIGMSLPFILHLFFVTRRFWFRVFVIAYVGVALYIVIQTDSRLAFISFVSSLLLYILFQTFLLWRDRPNNLFAPAIVFAFAMFIALFVVLSFTWRRVEVMVWGGGAQAFSTDSRKEQISQGVPMIIGNPFGHGIGQGGDTLGYYLPGTEILTIDSYFLSVALEFGVLGFLIYYGMFAYAVGQAAGVALKTRDEEVLFLGAAAVAMLNFLLSKSVYSQTENHPLAFILLGMIVALLRRHKGNTGAMPPPPQEASLAEPKTYFAQDAWTEPARPPPG